MKHILLCGGAGTRLWPLSHEAEPKQLLKLFDSRSLLQLAIERNRTYCRSLMIMANQRVEAAVRSQVAELELGNPIQWVFEPVARNTAAVIAITALLSDPDEVLFVTPSDHLIENDSRYAATLIEAEKFAKLGQVVTIGLQPTYPETGFGYIHYEGNDVKAFIEKPTLEIAEKFVSSGNYLWNSGMFCFTANTILAELNTHASQILTSSKVAVDEFKKTGSISLKTMEAIPSESIDYAVMEKSEKVKVVPSSISWSDVGTYEALTEALTNRYGYIDNKILIGCGESGNFVFGDARPVALVGVEDLIVVDRPGGLLIMKKGEGQQIRLVHSQLKLQYPEFV